MNENTPKTMITQGLPEGAIPLGIVPPGIPFFPPDLMPQQLMFVTPEVNHKFFFFFHNEVFLLKKNQIFFDFKYC